MIPDVTLPTTEDAAEPSKTWQIDFYDNRIVGYVDGLEAVMQAARLRLETPRWQHPIYSWQYGSELKTLIGKDTDYAVSEAKRMILDALTADTRIVAVRDFAIVGQVLRFTVDTLYGSFQMSTEVITA